MGCNCGGSRAVSVAGKAGGRAERARPVAPVRERSKDGPGTAGYGSKSTRQKAQ